MPQNLTSVNGNLHVYFSYLVGNLHTINNLNVHTHTHTQYSLKKFEYLLF